MIEEEELSDDEIQRQIESTKYYNFMRNKSLKNQIKSFEQREKELEDEVGGCLVDLNETNRALKLKKANTQIGE